MEMKDVLSQHKKAALRDILLNALQAQGLNNSTLAARTNLSRQAIGAYLKGRSLPSRENALKIAKVLKLDPLLLLNPAPSASSSSFLEIRMAPREGWVQLIARVELPRAVGRKIYEQMEDALQRNRQPA